MLAAPMRKTAVDRRKDIHAPVLRQKVHAAESATLLTVLNTWRPGHPWFPHTCPERRLAEALDELIRAVRQRDELAPAAYVKFREHASDVDLNRSNRDEQT